MRAIVWIIGLAILLSVIIWAIMAILVVAGCVVCWRLGWMAGGWLYDRWELNHPEPVPA